MDEIVEKETETFDPALLHSATGIISIVVFLVAYIFVILEEKLHLRKSKPMLLAGGIIWILVAAQYASMDDKETAHDAIQDTLLEYAELLLFFLVAMTYINAMEERNVFQRLRVWLIGKGYSLRVVFWITGLLAFFISPIADNLTTALLMGTVTIAVGGDKPKFVTVACINIVVAANAGGAFSPFGDITTLMVWQEEILQFEQFFALFVPSLVNWLIPAFIMNFSLGSEPSDEITEKIEIKLGGKGIVFLFICTVATAVCFHSFLHLPPAAGMMLGLGYLGVFSHWLKYKEMRMDQLDPILGEEQEAIPVRHRDLQLVIDSAITDVEEIVTDPHGNKASPYFDMMRKVARAEWDTLLFFYGVYMCVGGISLFGYLTEVSNYMYVEHGASFANICVGVLAALFGNIPIMYAVITMRPEMADGQWALVTLTAGVGGSLLSIGSAAGVALMGTSQGAYSFMSHLKWAWAIVLGYAASIGVHFLINAKTF
ncbi:Na(+)/H(+) antiporter NhaD [Aduncisulcus paluster]|uniref:Na(+)/H(+) antiporter NhaD n=1 Tax=Aduncisulcus paluster TaxID=2918883 RepID=A0ABQ5KKE1_9EUKA|nr:Na(+)/H(+) antiporter NhaD [Aduncisulcus paluster]